LQTNNKRGANCPCPLQIFSLDCKIGGGFKYVSHPKKTCLSNFRVLISCNELGILFAMPQQTFWLFMFSSCVIYMLVIPSLSWNPSFYVAIMGIFGYANNAVSTRTFDHEQLVDSVYVCLRPKAMLWEQHAIFDQCNSMHPRSST